MIRAAFATAAEVDNDKDGGDNSVHTNANVVDGLFAIARAIDGLVYQVKYLGNGNAATQMGAIENLAKELKDGSNAISSSLDAIAGHAMHMAGNYPATESYDEVDGDAP